MAEKKTTKVEWFEILKEIVNESECDRKEELINFLDTQIETTKKRNLRQAQYKAKKTKEAVDGLYEAISHILNNEFQSVDCIMDQIDKTVFPNVTKNKVVARLKKLVDNSQAEKMEKSIGGSRLMHYKLIQNETSVE